jgi:hypothetical protein
MLVERPLTGLVEVLTSMRRRLWGLNTALISDEADAPNKLLVSEFQTAKLGEKLGVINVVMGHHPPDWLMDKAEVRQILRRCMGYCYGIFLICTNLSLEQATTTEKRSAIVS